MKFGGKVVSAAGLLLLVGISLVFGRMERHKTHKAGVFDYYTFVLSWSPTYCQENGKRDKQQCGLGRKFSFVVHGLWPQYNRGWPQSCRVKDSWVPNNLINAMLDVMPSRRLIVHEWKKHGTCSGMSAKGYFAATRKFYEVIKVPARYVAPSKTLLVSPEQVKKDFTSTNKWMKPNMISIMCGNRRDRGQLREIRFCFSKKGAPQACGENERRQCRAKVLVMPPVR